jgi:hypothetical protein
LKFGGQVRIPEIDHPGIPAAVLVEDEQVEIVLDGESLGRWSLYDVRARRLISSAFQLELDGEEITFLADEPIDFAYRGVERMAEVWARFKTMRAPRRGVAVRRSRSGTKPSRIQELRDAMEANLKVQAPSLRSERPVYEPARSPETVEIVPAPGDTAQPGLEEAEAEATEPVIESAGGAVSGSDQPDTGRATKPTGRKTPTRPSAKKPASSRPPTGDADREAPGDGAPEPESVVEAETTVVPMSPEVASATDRAASAKAEEGRLAEERARLAAERARLEGERIRLEELRREAEERDARRIEAFRIEMARLESERAGHERLEAERAASYRQEMETLQSEREKLEALDRERKTKASEDEERAQALQREMNRIELERQQMERLEQERLAAAQRDMEAVRAKRLELERLEAERAEQERLAELQAELERVAAEKAEADRLAAEKEARARQAERAAAEAEAARVAAEKAEAERIEARRLAAEQEERERLAAEQAERERLEEEWKEKERVEDQEVAAAQPEQDRRSRGPDVKEVLGTSTSEEGPESAKELVVDLGEFEDTRSPTGPEPALASAKEKAGFMGAVRSAFTRGVRSHEHEFVAAPGGLGISRSICRECGYVSISSDD